jgi:murein L,D-transpeptidase YcbB/YkuD
LALVRHVIGAAAFAAALMASEPSGGQASASLQLDPTLGAAVRELVTDFYATRPARNAWAPQPARDTALDLLRAAEHAEQDGLCAISMSELRAALNGFDEPDDAAARANDVRITVAIASYLLQLGLGRHTIATGQTLSARVLDVASLLEQAAIGRPARDLLDVTRPRHPEYAQLRRALAKYRLIAQSGGWPALPSSLRLYPDRHADSKMVTALVARLRASGDFSERVPSTPVGSYDADVIAAVRRFQARHSLAVDGIVGPATVRALNITVDRRIEQIAINMDRWRRLPDWLGDPHVRVNIPAFDLTVFDYGQPVLGMRVVVGTPQNQTPVFSDRIRYLDFNPYWNVPRSITVNELVPRVATDRDYLEEHGFEVLEGWSPDAEPIDPAAVDWEAERFSYRLRQLPGPDNALGRVKFMFPNRYSVYLHDTPADHLFSITDRARSHGCVRVEKPAELAAFLLRTTQGWTLTRVRSAMHQQTREVVRLAAPVPVHLLYFTASMGEQSTVQFFDDVYGRDERARRWLLCDRST